MRPQSSLNQYLILIIVLLIGVTNTQAEINDYFIRRLILYKSDCKLDTLSRNNIAGGKLEFYATCQNLSFYPDGVNILCNSDIDETSCEITTEGRKFKELDILQRGRE